MLLRGGLLAALVLAEWGCARETPALRVLAAASLSEVAMSLAEGFDGGGVEVALGASSALARQIRDGAPGDVFLSASPEWMDFLREAGALAGEPLLLARNRLVCIAARGYALGRARDPGSLLAALGAGDGVAIADPGVPAGEYARSALRALGLEEAYRPRLVGQKDVRAVLVAVERGELPAGFVYATDARIGGVEVLFEVDPTTHPAIEYQAAALRTARRPVAAQRFLAYLQSEPARRRLADAGFAIP